MAHGVDLFVQVLQICLAVAGVGAWLRIFERRRSGVPLAVAEPREPVPWNGGDVLYLAIAALLFEMAALSAVAGPSTSGPGTSGAVTLPILVAGAAARLGWIVFALVVLTARSGASWSSLGFDTHREAHDLRLAGLLFLAAVLPVYGTQLALNVGLGLESDHPLVTLAETEPNAGVLAIVTIVAVIVAPLVEEFLFRVLVQGWLEKRQVAGRETVDGAPAQAGYGPILISSVLFSLLHIGHGADPIPLFILGLFLGYAYRQTHRIIAPLAIHMMVNGLAMVELWGIYLRGGRW